MRAVMAGLPGPATVHTTVCSFQVEALGVCVCTLSCPFIRVVRPLVVLSATMRYLSGFGGSTWLTTWMHTSIHTYILTYMHTYIGPMSEVRHMLLNVVFELRQMSYSSLMKAEFFRGSARAPL